MLLKSFILLVSIPGLLAAPSFENPATGSIITRSDNETIVEPNDMSIMSGCTQETCPDYDATVDLYERAVAPAVVHYNVRVNNCGQCVRKKSSKDGCVSFNLCNKKHEICVDRKKERMHWFENGKKWCYKVTKHDQIWCGRGIGNMRIFSKSNEINCNW
jgi:hypothetical protein